MFPFSGQISDADSLLYDSPGENHLTNDPTRVFPDLQQILDNNTNADTGSCSQGPIAPPVSQATTECYMEFLPTSDYVGVAGVNADPLALHMRFTARDGGGGSNFADTTLLARTPPGRSSSPRRTRPCRSRATRPRRSRGTSPTRAAARQRGEREDQPLGRQWPHVPVRAGGLDAEHGLGLACSRWSGRPKRA